MKKIILLMSVCFVVSLLSNCTNSGNKANKENDNKTEISDDIVEIPDANFKAYLLEYFDKNKDGEISMSEANAVKGINCSGKNIKDLTGIENFVNIESLDCSNNQLSDIEIQKNKKLNKLACKGNNEGFQIYFGISSPLKNPEFQTPAAGGPPQNVSSTVNPLDVNKCSYDDGTLIMVLFDE